MCIAILTKAGASVPRELLGMYFDGNRDGAGFAYINAEDKVEIDKGYFSRESFLDKYEKLLADGRNAKPMLLHARIATTGKVGRDNCHPFNIKDGALIHNGTFWYGGRDAEFSDTRAFAATLHNVLTYDDINVNLKRIQLAVGGTNKVAMLFNEGKYLILNEDMGTWHDNVWYSNSYSLRSYNSRKT